jgi:Na+-driven multidrug efflux pump
MFQGLGNTKPALLSSGTRLIMYGLPLIWLSARPGFRIEQVWYLSIATTTLQAALSLWLLRLEFRKRLVPSRHEAGHRSFLAGLWRRHIAKRP